MTKSEETMSKDIKKFIKTLLALLFFSACVLIVILIILTVLVKGGVIL